MPERIIALSQQVSKVATAKVDQVRKVTRSTKILAVNAAIEAVRAGEAGIGFEVVAKEINSFSTAINVLADELQDELSAKIDQLTSLGRNLVAQIRGARLGNLALNMIDIVDRNLYERSCDVRWWATDSAVVGCVTRPEQAVRDHASRRLGVILDSYTVYLDLWIADSKGNVLANGRPDQYRSVKEMNVSSENWFRKALATADGTGFAACDIARNPGLGGASVATYSTAIREKGANTGRTIGVLGIFFDWEKQSQAVVDGVRLSEEERARTRCMLIDSQNRVIAVSSGGRGGLGLFEQYPLRTDGKPMGSYVDASGNLVGFAQTPGYETYKGLGWYGVVTQSRINL